MPDPATLDIELTPEERREAVEEPRRNMSDRIDADLAAWGYALALSELDDTIEVNGERLDDKIDAAIRMTARNHKYGGKAGIPLAALADQMRQCHTQQLPPVKRYLAGLSWDGKGPFRPFAAHLKDKTQPHHLRGRHCAAGHQGVAVALDGRRGGESVRVGRNPRRRPDARSQRRAEHGQNTLAAWLCPLPDMFLESSINPDSNDHLRYLVTKWIWEGKRTGRNPRRSDREALKAFLTRQEATFRKPYDHHPVIKPALASFIGTVNPMNNGFWMTRPAAVVSWWRNWQALTTPMSPALTAISFGRKCWTHGATTPGVAAHPEEQNRATASTPRTKSSARMKASLYRIFDIDPGRLVDGDTWIIGAVRTYGDAIFDETRHHGVLGSTLRGLGLGANSARRRGARLGLLRYPTQSEGMDSLKCTKSA